MKHAEKITPIAAALTSLATLACCLPTGFAAAAAALGLSAFLVEYQPWLFGASIVLLIVGLIQLTRVGRTCSRTPYGSIVVFGLSALTVILVIVFPQMLAALIADWWP